MNSCVLERIAGGFEFFDEVDSRNCLVKSFEAGVEAPKHTLLVRIQVGFKSQKYHHPAAECRNCMFLADICMQFVVNK